MELESIYFSYLGLLILLYVISSYEKTTFHLYNLYIISELNTFYPLLYLKGKKRILCVTTKCCLDKKYFLIGITHEMGLKILQMMWEEFGTNSCLHVAFIYYPLLALIHK